MLKLSANFANRELTRALPKSFSLTRGTKLRSEEWIEAGFEIEVGADEILIRHATRSDYFRALAELLRKPKLVRLRGVPQLKFRGLMIDASRNGVPRVDFLKNSIIELALFGFNYLTLYTEDTYEIRGHPLIGYQRGAYSKAELREVRKYAAEFGIEMFPCIQTLAHLDQILQYKLQYADIRDTQSVLSVKSPKALEFIETLIDNARAPYDSELIHVGMDEPWDIGRGACFTPKQKIDPRELYLEHLIRVAKLCAERKLKPIVWGDIVIGQHREHGDLPMTAPQWRRLPKNVTFNYWNYFSEDPKIYASEIEIYRKYGFDPIVSPGIWNWDRFYGHYEKAKRTLTPLLTAAKRANVRGALMTMWGDDGQECSFRSNLPALALFAEHAYHSRIDEKAVAALVAAVACDSFKNFILPCKLDAPDEAAIPGHGNFIGNFAKSFIWDDPLLRLFSAHFGKRRHAAHYERLSAELAEIAQTADAKNRKLFRFTAALAHCLAVKADLGQRAFAAYHKRDTRELRRLTKDTTRTIALTQKLWKAHRTLWLSEYKPFGLEVLDVRYGGVIARLQVLRERLRDFATKRVQTIEEFDVEPQRFLGEYPFHLRKYRGTYTASFSTWP